MADPEAPVKRGEWTAAEVLSRAADLIEPEGAWTQGASARDAAGAPVVFLEDRRACSFCLMGAVWRTRPETDDGSDSFFVKYVEPVTQEWPADWNDAPGRTQAEVVAALREASKRALRLASNSDQGAGE